MNITLSKRGDYVMRSAIFLARTFDGPAPRKIREVVEDTEIPRTIATQSLADLVRAGLASSKSGRGGGYQLTRSPAEISVLEVIEAAEGPLRADRCALGEGPCRWDAVCPLHETWSDATAALRDKLASTSLAEVAERDAAIQAGTYQVPESSHRLHPSAFPVADFAHVELAEPTAHQALARLAQRLVPLAAAALALGGADAAAPSNGKAGTSPRSKAKDVEVSLGPVNGGYLLAWRYQGPGGAVRLEADLSLEAVDDERCELRLGGTWYASAKSATGGESGSRARQAVRLFLRNLAREMEAQAARAAPGRSKPASRP